MLRLGLAATALVLALVVGGCDALAVLSKAVTKDAPFTPFAIPPPRPPAAAASIEDALAVYPLPETIKREPFLTPAEEVSLRTGKPIEEEKKVEVVVEVPKEKPVAVLRRKLTLGPLERFTGVDFVAYSPKDGNHVAFLGKQALQKGTRVGDFIVTGISEEGIRLRSVDGSEARFLKFKHEAAQIWKNGGENH